MESPEERATRLAEALRANLRRRKVQAREMGSEGESAPPALAAPDPAGDRIDRQREEL